MNLCYIAAACLFFAVQAATTTSTYETDVRAKYQAFQTRSSDIKELQQQAQDIFSTFPDDSAYASREGRRVVSGHLRKLSELASNWKAESETAYESAQELIVTHGQRVNSETRRKQNIRLYNLKTLEKNGQVIQNYAQSIIDKLMPKVFKWVEHMQKLKPLEAKFNPNIDNPQILADAFV